MRRVLTFALLISVMALLVACEGDRGPMGPPGPQGAQGDPGPGTRLVYQSTTPIPTEDYTVAIPEITLDDMPSISVFVSFDGTGAEWYEIPQTWFTEEIIWTEAYILTEGNIRFFLCNGLHYKVVIII